MRPATPSNLRRLAFVVILIGLPAASSASIFEAAVIDADCQNVAFSASPASGSWSNGVNGIGMASAEAFAEGGSVGGSALATASGSIAAFASAAACFKARVVIDDIVISGPGSDVSTQVSARLDGSLSPSNPFPFAVGSVFAAIDAETVGGSALSPTAQFSTGSVDLPVVVDTTLTTASFLAPVGHPFAVRMQIESEVDAADNAGLTGGSSSASDFAHTLSFVEGSPVFDLPVGYTANSMDGQIVDNLFVGNAASAPALPVPGLVALVLALGLVGALRLGR